MNALVIANTQIRRDPAGRYCLNDLHQASGGARRHEPGNWLILRKTQELVAEINQSLDSNTGIPVLESAVESVHGGPTRGTYAVKELVYAYAMWISAKFHLHVIRAYDALQQAGRAERHAPAPSLAPSHRADVLVGAARGFSALVRAGRMMGLGRQQAVHSANAATLRDTGIDLVDTLQAGDAVAAMVPGALGHDGGVAQFHHAMQAGELDVPYHACLSRDAFYLYQHWCRKNGLPALTMPRFLHGLRVDQGVRIERRRYGSGDKVFGPASIALWGHPATFNGSADLGRYVIAFQQAVEGLIKAAA